MQRLILRGFFGLVVVVNGFAVYNILLRIAVIAGFLVQIARCGARWLCRLPQATSIICQLAPNMDTSVERNSR